MAKTVADVMKMVKDNEIKFVDFRFTDTRGKEQHVTVPVSHFDEDKFSSGHAFDGSSIAGWKGIEASDMLLMPDPNTANIDPFFEEPTLILTCDVLEPGDGKPYERDPRSLAKRAEAYLKSSGIGDAAFFGPEPEFFVFDSVRWNIDMSGCFVKIELRRGGLEHAARNSRAATRATAPASRAATSRCRRSTASRTCAPRCACCSSSSASRSRCTTTKWPAPARWRSAPSSAPWCSAPTGCNCRSTSSTTWPMPTARRRPSCPSPSSATTAAACTCTSRVWKDGKNLFAGDGYARPVATSRCTTSAASSSTPAR